MNSIGLTVARRIVPELLDVLQERVRILQRLRLLQPVGRRALAQELKTTERVLRTEVDFLRRQGLLVSTAAGMSLSDEGYAVLDELEEVLASLEGRTELGRRLSRGLGIPEVLVVSGDSDEDEWAKNTLGYHTAICLRAVLVPGDVVAVTGGTTMSAVARMMPEKSDSQDVKLVPARGGLGETMSIQANTIASELASRMGGMSMMLHVPDRLSEETLQHLVSEPDIRARLQTIRSATVVVHGIGSAERMARRRGLPEAEQASLQRKGAVAEAFGYYFDFEGQIVQSMPIIGMRLEDLKGVRKVIAVAGGESKAQAILAAAKAYRVDILVTDEGAGKAMLDYLHGGDFDDSSRGN